MENNNIKTLYAATKELLPILEARGDEPELSLKTLPDINRKLWGLKKRGLTLIGARTSHGKSAFALQIAYDLALQGKKVLILSLEMTICEMAERLLCLHKKIDNYALLSGKFKNNMFYMTKYNETLKDFYKAPLILSDCIGRTWQDVDSIVMQTEDKPDVVIIDYIQAITGGKSTTKDSIDDYILHLREMAIRHNFAAVVCSQINRESQGEKDKTPKVHNLKSTGTLEECADVIMLLYWRYKNEKEDNSKNDYTVLVEKNRNGRTGIKHLKFYPESYLFQEETETLTEKYLPPKNHQDKEEVDEWEE